MAPLHRTCILAAAISGWLAVHGSVHAQSSDSEEASNPMQSTIRFPDEAIGIVSIHPGTTANFGYKAFRDGFHEGWQEHGPAAGEVVIPDGFAVRLELNQEAALDPSWINRVPHDAIDAIFAYGVPLGDDGFERLARFSSLRQLDLDNAGLTSAIAAHLPRLSSLQYLALTGIEEIGDEAMTAVAELPHLEFIRVSVTGVTDAGFKLLSKSTSIKGVVAGRTRITDSGFAALTRLADLRALSVYATAPEFRGDEPNPSISDMGVSHLESCRDLEHLDISGSQVTDGGLERIAADCPKLRRLMLDYSAITTQGLYHVGGVTQLEQLRCYGTPIDDSAVQHFSSLHRLREIGGDVELSNAGVEVLAGLKKLEKLELSGELDDRCMAAVAGMASLRDLTIEHTRITGEGFALLADSPTLERVQITGNRMTTRCIETLASIPNLKQVGLMSVDPRADGKPVWKGLGALSSLKRELWLFGCPPLQESDFAKLADFRDLAQLRIEGGRLITDRDVRHLKNLDSLEYLELISSVVTDEGLAVIASLSGLEVLRIHCLCSEEGLKILAGAPRLSYLTIGSPNIGDDSVERILSQHPTLAVRRVEFRLGGAIVSRSKTAADEFWRRGKQEEREALNALEGKSAPSLVVTDWVNSDSPKRLDDFRGSVVLVMFWGTWCGPCRVEMPEVRQLHEELAGHGLVVIGVHSTKAAEDAADYIASNDIPFPVAEDDNNDTATAYAVPGWPSFYLIDQAGVLRMANPHRGQLRAAIESLLDE